VIDTGSGIPANQLEGIFDNHWQSRKSEGAGVGLAIVKTMVEAHGGTVEIQSQSGRGTTVTFSLPRRRPVGASMKKPTVNVRTSGPTPDWTL
jgi:signal transduction histidine kinase